MGHGRRGGRRGAVLQWKTGNGWKTAEDVGDCCTLIGGGGGGEDEKSGKKSGGNAHRRRQAERKRERVVGGGRIGCQTASDWLFIDFRGFL